MEPPEPSEQLPPRITITVPPEAEVGVFANFASIWQDDVTVVLDFAAVTGAPNRVEQDDGTAVADVRARVVSRVRIAPRQALELMRGLTRQLDQWEATHGPVVALTEDQ